MGSAYHSYTHQKTASSNNVLTKIWNADKNISIFIRPDLGTHFSTNTGSGEICVSNPFPKAI